MLQFDILGLIPQSLKRQALDTLVDFVSEQARKYASEEVAAKIKKLRSDAAFNQAFEEGLRRAVIRFVQEYEIQDEDLVAAIAADEDFFNNEEIRAALLTILKKPGVYLAGERERLAEPFDSVLPGRKNRERVDRAVIYLLKCLAEEVWHLPELQPIYSLQFQRMTAAATRQQVELQKAQLQALSSLNAGVREALLQLTDAIAERKLLPPGGAPALPASPSKPKVYRNLPQPDYGRFVGREQELAQVVRILRPYPHSQHALVTIDGIGGIGKSALALEVAHRYLRNYERIPPEERFEAIIWTSAKQSVLTAEGIQLRGQALRTLDDVYTTIAVTLQREDISRARSEEQAEVVRNTLTRQRTLLIVDNLETVDDEAVLSFLRELPAPTKAIVTTRHRIDVAYPVRLVGMQREDAQRLIAQECAKKGVTLREDEAYRLYNRTGGVPLAMVWSIAQMGFGYGVEAVLTRLGQPTGDIAKFCFARAMEGIQGKPAHKLLMALSIFATDASREALGYVTNLPELDRDEGLVELEGLSLVNKHKSRFVFLPLTKMFASAELTNHPAFDVKAQRRWVDYLKELCKGAVREYYWRYLSYAFYDEVSNILEAIQWSYEHGTADDVFVLTLAACNYLEVTGRWNEILVLCDQALSLARSVQNPAAIARLANTMGWVRSERGEYQEADAMYSEALIQYQQVGNQEGEGLTLQHLSTICRKRRKFDKAEQLCERAWKIAEDLRVGDLKALIKDERGKLARDIGNWELAWQYFAGVRDWFEERVEQSPRDEALARSIWGQLAIVAYHLGRPQETKELCLKSLEFYETYGNKGYMATLKYRLALAEEALGEREAALEHAGEAVDWFGRLGMKPDYAEAKGLLERLQRN
jgi:tetratricopeptide (TPR) repeat protein